MKAAGIREFKAQLSRFLREVQTGETLLITDRGRVVAEVRPPGAATAALGPEELRFQRAVESGLIRPARTSPEAFNKRWAHFRGLGLPEGTAQALLDAERAEEGC